MIEEFKVYGLMIQFRTPEEVLKATRKAREAGFRRMDAYTPYTVEGLSAELGMTRSRIPSIVLIGGIVGACTGFYMQYYSMAVDFPFNVGGRPTNSWPVFIPIAFEMLILIASLSAFIGILMLNGLPHPNHPVFNVPEFSRASQDRFFLLIEATDDKFEVDSTTKFLAGLQPEGDVLVVPIAPEAVEESEPAVGGKAAKEPAVTISGVED